MVSVNLEYTLKYLFFGKLYNWYRRSLLKYFLATILFAVGVNLSGIDTEEIAIVTIVLMVFQTLIVISFAAIFASTFIIFMKLKKQNKLKFNLTFNEEKLVITESDGSTNEMDWSCVKSWQDLPDKFNIRLVISKMKQSYFMINKNSLPAAKVEELQSLLKLKVNSQ